MENTSIHQNTIEVYLNEIAERLANGHASVMVGAGFSKNAINKFPTWDELGMLFYKKLNNGNKPKEDVHFLNPLKLASEFEALFKKNKLNNFLKKSIPDKEFTPSKLHVDLLNLPWVDVFTTNYDTLLERAAKQVFNRRFNIVTQEKQLPFSSSPRIIKLHGCFDNDTDLIITEDDYRDYPKKHAPFVNTVQQSLIENTLCLIGFSGDDPNFLNWISWILYNLGDVAAPQIYLIELFGITEAKRKLLEKRHITVVDLSTVPQFGEVTSQAAIEYFLTSLDKYIQEKDKSEWPEGVVLEIKDMDLTKNIDKWRFQREAYPNWLILPYHNREKLRIDVNQWLANFNKISHLDFPFNINFLYEFNWRIEKCLYPIWNNNIPVYEKILQDINPFPLLLNTESQDYASDDSKENWEEIGVQWIELHFSLLRLFRQEGFWGKWEQINGIIEKIQSELTPEQTSLWFYEKALKFFLQLDFVQTRNSLSQWPVNYSLPYWEAKRASLLAELGDGKEAYSIVDQALQVVREKLNLSTNKNDYTLVSQEGYIIQLHWNIYNLQLENFELGEYEQNRQLFNKRWKESKSIVDPRGELELFEMNLKHKYSGESNQTITHSYDLGRISWSTHFGPSTEIREAYAYLFFCEEVGFPVFNIVTVQGALERIGKYSPFWAFAFLLRAGSSDEKLVDTMFNRESVSRLSLEKIDSTIDEYLKLLHFALDNLSSKRQIFGGCINTKVAKVVPEIVSRLTSKCSEMQLDKILETLLSICNSEKIIHFNHLDVLLNRLLNAYSKRQLIERIPKLFAFPILADSRFDVEPFSMDSIYSVRFRNQKIDLSSVDVPFLLEMLKSDNEKQRDGAFARLFFLKKFNLLKEHEIEQFAVNLWKRTDTVGMPIQNVLLNASILEDFPITSTIDPSTIYKEYILQKNKLTKTDRQEDDNSRASINEINWASKRWRASKGIVWNKDELNRLVVILLDSWNLDKAKLNDHHLNFMGRSISKLKREYFSYLVIFLTDTVFPLYSKEIDAEVQQKLKILLSEMEEHNLSCDTARVASLILFPEEHDSVEERIKRNCLSNDDDVLHNAFMAIYTWIIYYKDKLVETIPDNLICPLIECVKWRYPNGIRYALQSLNLIIKEASEFLVEKDFEEICIGLEMLQFETEPLNKNSNFEIFEVKMDVRKHTARLAYTLYQYFNDQRKEIPQSLDTWKSICENSEEFVEIRNQWEI